MKYRNLDTKNRIIDNVPRGVGFMGTEFSEIDSLVPDETTWLVEYYAYCNGDESHHLSVLHAENQQEAHKALLKELHHIYGTLGPVEVRVVRMEIIAEVIESQDFENIYSP